MTENQERSVPKPVFTDAEAGAKTFPDSTKRSFNYYTPAKPAGWYDRMKSSIARLWASTLAYFR
jgi:hypothetical protein